MVACQNVISPKRCFTRRTSWVTNRMLSRTNIIYSFSAGSDILAEIYKPCNVHGTPIRQLLLCVYIYILYIFGKSKHFKPRYNNNVTYKKWDFTACYYTYKII